MSKDQQQQARLEEAVLTRILGDARLAAIVREYGRRDERGRETLLRMAKAMPAPAGATA